MNAVIKLDVQEWQIGQDVTVYFPDTMLKHGKCELLKEQEAKRDYEASVEMAEYCERYEQTYNPEDGSM